MLALHLLLPLAACGRCVLVIPPFEEVLRCHILKERSVLSVGVVVPVLKLRNMAHDCRGKELVVVVSGSAPEPQCLDDVVFLE